MRHAEFKKYDHVGPGGRKCPCCGPAKCERRQHDRAERRRAKARVRQDIRVELAMMTEEGLLR